MDTETLRAINDVSKKINGVEKKLDEYFKDLHEVNSSAIDEILLLALNGGKDNV